MRDTVTNDENAGSFRIPKSASTQGGKAMQATLTEQGLVIPNEMLARWGEITVEERPFQIVVRPRSVTQLTYGVLRGDSTVLEGILEDVEAGGATIAHGEPATGFHAE